MREQFIQLEIIRVRGLFNATKHAPGFITRQHLATWYGDMLVAQDCKCHYCESSIFDIRRLIEAGLLATRAVRGNGVRGPVLEIDKKTNGLGYTPGNCVLACYYCNNDKSYTMNADEYKEYYGPGRHRHFQHLIAQLDNQEQ